VVATEAAEEARVEATLSRIAFRDADRSLVDSLHSAGLVMAN
jgi:hypothetical protein